jgi:outer membrane biogenesis lipoprotein LolB
MLRLLSLSCLLLATQASMAAAPTAADRQESGAAAAVAAGPPVAAAATDARVKLRGRLSVLTETVKGLQQMHGQYALEVDAAGGGQLQLFNPLGATVAVLAWTEHMAMLRRANGDMETFADARELLWRTLGASIEPRALLQWLRGEPLEGVELQGLSADGFVQLGWRALVSREGGTAPWVRRLVLSKLEGPPTELRIVVDEVGDGAPQPRQP